MPAAEWPAYRPSKPRFGSPEPRTLTAEGFARFVAELVMYGITAIEAIGCREIPAGAFELLRCQAWTAVNLSDTNAVDATVDALLPSAASLDWFVASKTNLSGNALRPLAAMQCLRELGLSECAIDDEALSDLWHCSSLVSLGLNGTRLSRSVLENAHRLEHLAVLGIGGIALGDCRPSEVHLPNTLRALNAPDCGVTDRLLAALVPPQMSELYLAGNDISDHAVKTLERLPLTALDVSRSSITTAGAYTLAGMPMLKRLGLSGCAVSERVLDALAASPCLELVALRGIALSRDSLDRLRELRPLLRVIV